MELERIAKSTLVVFSIAWLMSLMLMWSLFVGEKLRRYLICRHEYAGYYAITEPFTIEDYELNRDSYWKKLKSGLK